MQYFTGKELVNAALAKQGDPYSIGTDLSTPISLLTVQDYTNRSLADDPGKDPTSSTLISYLYNPLPQKGWNCSELVSWLVYQLSGKTLTFGMDQAPGAFAYPSTVVWQKDFDNHTTQSGVYLVEVLNYAKAINTAGVLFNKSGVHIAISVGDNADVVSALFVPSYKGVY